MNYNNTRDWHTLPACEFPELPDPRVAIARHIGWTKTTSAFTEYTTPEPNNYNRSVCDVKYRICNFIEDQVYYFDAHRQLWFTVYYVPEQQITEFDIWMDALSVQARWRPSLCSKLRPQRRLLWAKASTSDHTLTDNERLFTLGYYDELRSQHFTTDDSFLNSALGQRRSVLDNFDINDHINFQENTDI
jgi:hypothetical protein